MRNLILLNLNDDSLFAYRRSESWQIAKRVARNIEQIIRVMGTLFSQPEHYQDADTTVVAIEEATGADPESPFWKDVVLGV